MIASNLRKQLGGEPGDVASIANAIANGDLDCPIELARGDTAA